MSIVTPRAPRTESEPDEPRHPWRSRRLVAIVVAVAAVVLAGVAVWLVAFSSVFGVGTVAVRGTHLLSAGQVRSAAHVAAGTPLVRLDTDAVRRRVQRLPEVASARVTTSFPSTVTITVTDRTAIGYVRSSGKAVLVDRTGKRFRTVRHAASTLPRLVLPHGSATTARAVAAVAASLPRDLLARTSSIQALTPQSITVVLDGDRVVQWGTATRNADKARVLPVLLRRKDLHIDVTDPDQPFTR
ncbi:cell division protein FtsQ/DivIB [uncultured Jatrophihabitans sp.]|uniref:cell division protein FtsQ/DivIB n=1 Tax=uncultured Jatrophihabitans sp. TaxID=1610747 RepID=UPI0035C95FB0